MAELGQFEMLNHQIHKGDLTGSILFSLARKLRGCVIALLCTALTTACVDMSPSPSVVYSSSILPSVLDREQLADQKHHEQDASGMAEYQIAYGLAITRIEKIELAMRDAIFLSRNPVPARAIRDFSGYISWKQEMLEFQLSLTTSEHSHLVRRVEQMSSNEMEIVLAQGSNLGAFTQEMNIRALRGLLEEWRGLKEALKRIQRKCQECN